jgi:hypothetical protein
MSESNIQLFKRWFEEVWNQRRTATITELFAPNGVSHGVDENGADIIGPAATNKPVAIGGMSLARIANGQLVEAWDQWDKLAMLQQIGAVPPLAANAAAAKSANG